MLVRLVQSSKAERPIELTLSGMVMLVRLLQSRKAEELIPVTGQPSISDGMVRLPEAEVL